MTRLTQRGFSLVSAIFLVVVIAALGTFAVSVSTTQHQGSALDMLGTRAYQAARAGTEWGVYQVLRNPGGISCTPGGASNAVEMPAAPSTLAGFSVNVECRSHGAATEAGVAVSTFELVSTATTAGVATGTPGFVERQISVTIAR